MEATIIKPLSNPVICFLPSASAGSFVEKIMFFCLNKMLFTLPLRVFLSEESSREMSRTKFSCFESERRQFVLQ